MLWFLEIQNWRRLEPTTSPGIAKMAVYGNIGQFQEEIECFSDYTDRFDAFLLANKIEDARKSSLFFS